MKTDAGNDIKKPENPGAKLKNELFDWLEMAVLAMSVVFMIFTFFARVSIVSGPSMEDTLHNGDVLVVSDLLYTPSQGDIIVVQTPTLGYEEPIVKRVIATDGQTVRIDTDTWEVTVDGKVLDEPYVKRVSGNMRGWVYGDSYLVPDGCVFVMGDNRNNSKDSRSYDIGAVDERFIIGKVILRFFPLNKLGSVN